MTQICNMPVDTKGLHGNIRLECTWMGKDRRWVFDQSFCEGLEIDFAALNTLIKNPPLFWGASAAARTEMITREIENLLSEEIAAFIAEQPDIQEYE